MLDFAFRVVRGKIGRIHAWNTAAAVLLLEWRIVNDSYAPNLPLKGWLIAHQVKPENWSLA
jgi:hypothetical protein